MADTYGKQHDIAAATSAAATATGTPDGILCPFGCGKYVPLAELDSHEAAHELQGPQETNGRELDDTERQLMWQQEQEQFEKLRRKYGFSDQVGGP